MSGLFPAQLRAVRIASKELQPRTAWELTVPLAAVVFRTLQTNLRQTDAYCALRAACFMRWVCVLAVTAYTGHAPHDRVAGVHTATASRVHMPTAAWSAERGIRCTKVDLGPWLYTWRWHFRPTPYSKDGPLYEAPSPLFTVWPINAMRCGPLVASIYCGQLMPDDVAPLFSRNHTLDCRNVWSCLVHISQP